MRAATILIATIVIAMVSVDAQIRPQLPRSIFNGKNLDGWRGDPALWSVIDGVITGTSAADGDRKIEQNSFLIYRSDDIKDFELTLKARVTGENNSGIQYRSHVVDDSKYIVSGYQLDIHPKPSLVGMIYEERGRGIIAKRGRAAKASADEIKIVGSHDDSEKIDIGKWNDYTIIARGNFVIHKVNGKVTSTLRDDDPALRSLQGVIALQLHAGAPMKIEAKDIVLRRLQRATVASPIDSTKTPPIKLPNPKWISPAKEHLVGESAYFRHNWRPKAPVESATLQIASSGEFQIFLNGKEIGKGSGGREARRFEVGKELTEFNNLLTISVAPGDTTPSFAAQIDFTHVDDSISRNASDQNWLSRFAKEAPSGWTGKNIERRTWRVSRESGDIDQTLFALPHNAPNKQANLEKQTSPPGFQLEKIYEVPVETSSQWVALTNGPKGKLFASAQNGGLFQIDIGTPESGIKVERINLDIDHANGLLWAFDHLFVCVNHPAKSGLYRLNDSNGDGKLDNMATIRRFTGSGENGPHGIVLGPSPQSIYLICGNQTALPEPFSRYRVPKLWRNDDLLTETPQGEPSPGGWIAMTRPAGIEWELHAVGLRNPYDLAFNRHGDLFTCDASPPQDQGMPFFRPTSIYHVPKGADLGTRGVANNFPPQYQDTIPPITQLAPGTPSALTFGYGAKFPHNYQQALFVADRSNSTITAVHLEALGASYTARSEPFVTGLNLAVIDITIGSDGAMYILSSKGEAPSELWRVTYTGDELTRLATKQPFTPNVERKQMQRDRLGLLQGIKDKRAVNTAWRHLADADRTIRNTARTVIEHHPAELTLELLVEEADANAIIEATTAVARIGGSEHQSTVLEKLASIDFSALSSAQKVTYLRATGLIFTRLAPPTAEQRQNLIEKISPTFPSRDEALDLELARILIYLSAPSAIEPTLTLLNSTKSPESAAAYATFLSHAKDGWTPEAKANYLAWFRIAAEQDGKENRKTYLNRLKSAFFREDPDKNE